MSLVLFCFCSIRRDVHERASSDAGEAGLNEMRVQRDRVQFHGGGASRVQFTMQASEPRLDSHLIPLF